MQWVQAKLVVVVEILVTQRNPKESLSDQAIEPMFHEPLIPTICETPGQSPDQSHAALHLTQHQAATVTADITTREIGGYFASTNVLKSERLLRTVCHSEVPCMMFSN